MRNSLLHFMQDNDGETMVQFRQTEKAGVVYQYQIPAEVMNVPIGNKVVRLKPVIPQVTLIAATPDMEQVMATAGRLCYSRAGIDQVLKKADPGKFLAEQIVPAGHHSVIEHALFTFGVEGISRACSHQIVRHRHMSFDQQSQRYVDIYKYKEPVFEFIIPPALARNGELFKGYINGISRSLINYVWALEQGVAAEDARMFLMNAAATKMVVSANPRALYEFLSKRLCALAQWEIDIVATEMLRLAYPHAPSVFATAGPGCSRGKCPEGKRCCLIPITAAHTYMDEELAPHDGWNGKMLGDLTPDEQKEAARRVRQRQAAQKLVEDAGTYGKGELI